MTARQRPAPATVALVVAGEAAFAGVLYATDHPIMAIGVGFCPGSANFVCPTYDLKPLPGPSTAYAIATGVAVGANIAALTLNVLHMGMAHEASGVLGVGTGFLGVFLGLGYLGEEGSRHKYGVVNAGLGAASMAVGVYRLMGGDDTRVTSRLVVSPWIGGDGAPGLVARLAF